MPNFSESIWNLSVQPLKTSPLLCLWQGGHLPWHITLSSRRLSRSHDKNISPATVPLATKLGKMVTYLKGLPSLKTHDTLITWQTKTIISPLLQSLWPPNLRIWYLPWEDCVPLTISHHLYFLHISKFRACYITGQWGEFTVKNATLHLHILSCCFL